MEQPRSEWAVGRWLVLVSMFGAGTAVWYQGVTGVVMKPLAAEFGWTRSEVTSSHFIVGIVSVLLAWAMGSVIDRIGSRKVVLVGVVLNAIGFAIIGLTGPGIVTWYAAWVIYGLCQLFIHPVVFVTPISKIFVRHRALAMAAVLSGAGLSLALVPYAATRLEADFGWRGVYFGLAAGFIFQVLPLLALWFREPVVDQKKRTDAPAEGMTLAEALRTTRLYRLALPALLVAASNGLMVVHFVPMMTDRGLSAVNAAVAIGLFGPCNTVGRLAMGWLIDRLHAPYVSAVAALLPLFYVALYFSFNGTFGYAIVMGITLGLASGAESDAVAYMVSRYFGIRRYGAIFGLVFGCHSAGFACGPLIGGLFFDHFGGYDQVILLIAGCLITASVLFATLGRYAKFETHALPDSKAWKE
jgi:predicted MFS family arabinose efflux permease